MQKVLILGLTLCALTLVGVSADAQVKKGKTRAALTKHIMGGIVQPNCAALGKGTKEAPADDKAWAALETNAALLNEVGHLLMDDGRCPDEVWAGAAKKLQEGSAAVLAKVESKDLDGAAKAFATMTEACGACHKAHKKQ